MSGGGVESKGDTESKAHYRLQVVSTEPDAGLKLTNHKIMTFAKVGLSHPGIPRGCFFFF